MANIHPLEQTCVLKVKINCCKACPGKLKKGLLKIKGVHSVDVDPKKNLISVTSELDPKKLIKKIKKIGKKAELVQDKEQNHAAVDHDDDEETDEEDEEHAGPSCCHKNSSSNNNNNSAGHQSKTHAPQNHPLESFMATPKEFPEHICRDIHCRIHRRDSIIFDRVPQTNYSPMFWGHPNSSGNQFYHGGRMNYPIRSSDFPPPPPPPPPPGYGGPRMMPPAGYGGNPIPRTMPRPRVDGYADYFNDEYSNGCSVM